MSTQGTKPKAATKSRRKPGAPKAKAVRKRLEFARDHVYWASGIVACCAYAAGAGLYPDPDKRSITHALEGAHALLERGGGAVLDVLDDELDERQNEQGRRTLRSGVTP